MTILLLMVLCLFFLNNPTEMAGQPAFSLICSRFVPSEVPLSRLPINNSLTTRHHLRSSLIAMQKVRRRSLLSVLPNLVFFRSLLCLLSRLIFITIMVSTRFFYLPTAIFISRRIYRMRTIEIMKK